MKIYSNQELKDMQLSGAQPTYEWDLLNTKYKDRWEKASDVCKLLTSDPSRFIQDHIIEVTTKRFDDFAGDTKTDNNKLKQILGL